jgi:hypothetical protein
MPDSESSFPEWGIGCRRGFRRMVERRVSGLHGPGTLFSSDVRLAGVGGCLHEFERRGGRADAPIVLLDILIVSRYHPIWTQYRLDG